MTEPRHIMNMGFIGALLSPLGMLYDNEIASLMKTDPNNEKQVKRVIDVLVLPRFERFSPESRTVVKNSLRFLLNDNSPETKALIEDIFYDFSPPFRLPDDPKLFYQWLWNELFPKDDTSVEDLSQYIVAKEKHLIPILSMAPGDDPKWHDK